MNKYGSNGQELSKLTFDQDLPEKKNREVNCVQTSVVPFEAKGNRTRLRTGQQDKCARVTELRILKRINEAGLLQFKTLQLLLAVFSFNFFKAKSAR